MKSKMLKLASLAVSLFVFASSFVGCGTKSADKQEAAAPATTSSSASQTFSYPMQTSVSLKYWLPMHNNWASYAKNIGELPMAQDLQKKTGVKIEFIHPPLGQDRDVFNILIASGDYPDMIEYRWTDFPGGPGSAINGSIIIKLNDVISKWSPNLKKFLAERPNYDKECKMDDGTYYFYPFLRDGKELANTSGPIFRKDWLADAGLPVPETIEDWYNALKAFKEKKKADIPLTAIGDKNGTQVLFLFEGAYNTFSNFYMKDKKIYYGPMDPTYKDQLTFLAKLYQEGLLDKNFGSTDSKARDSNMLNGKSGVTYGAGGGQIGTYLATMKDKDPKYDLVAAKFPVLKKGDRMTIGNTSTGMDRNTQVAISTKCKNVEAAARFLDYGYSPEGHNYYNFGTEGKSWTMVNGVPTYSAEVMKNPDKLTIAQAMSKYARGNMSGPFAQNVQYILQYYELPQQKEALKVWSDHDKASSLLPLVTPTDTESADTSKIMNDVQTYVQEMQYKFIMGQVPLSDFDKYIDQLKKMNIEKAVAMKQASLDRFYKR